jgi:hypothetical protein
MHYTEVDNESINTAMVRLTLWSTTFLSCACFTGYFFIQNNGIGMIFFLGCLFSALFIPSAYNKFISLRRLRFLESDSAKALPIANTSSLNILMTHIIDETTFVSTITTRFYKFFSPIISKARPPGKDSWKIKVRCQVCDKDVLLFITQRTVVYLKEASYSNEQRKQIVMYFLTRWLFLIRILLTIFLLFIVSKVILFLWESGIWEKFVAFLLTILIAVGFWKLCLLLLFFGRSPLKILFNSEFKFGILFEILGQQTPFYGNPSSFGLITSVESNYGKHKFHRTYDDKVYLEHRIPIFSLIEQQSIPIDETIILVANTPWKKAKRHPKPLSSTEALFKFIEDRLVYSSYKRKISIEDIQFLEKIIARVNAEGGPIENLNSSVLSTTGKTARNKKWTELHKAIRNDDDKKAEELISAGEFINDSDEVGRTPLHVACWMGNVPIVIKLVIRGGNLKAKQDNGKTPRDVALDRSNTKLAEILLKLGG